MFTIVTIEKKEILEVQTIKNHAREGTGGVGIQAVQIIGNQNINEVVVDLLGPNAANSLNAVNIKIYHASGGKLTVPIAIRKIARR